MSSTEYDTTTDPEYRLFRVEKIEPPTGMQGTDWYRYIVKRKNGDIIGNRCGSYQQVESYAQSFTDGLNARSASLGNSMWTRPRKYQDSR